MTVTARPGFLISLEVPTHLLDDRLKGQLHKIPGQAEQSPKFVDLLQVKTTEIVFAADARPGALPELAMGVEEWFRAHPELRPPLCERDQTYMSRAGNCYVCEQCGDVVLADDGSSGDDRSTQEVGPGQQRPQSASFSIKLNSLSGFSYALLMFHGGSEPDHAKFVLIVQGIEGIDRVEKAMPGDFLYDHRATASYVLTLKTGVKRSDLLDQIVDFAREHNIEVERS